jgi:hypothetical protein
MPKIILPSVAPQLQEPIIQDKRLKRGLSQESELCYVQNEAQRPQYISSK